MPRDKMLRVQKTFSKPSLTKQSFANDANINVIMARWERDGLVQSANQRAPQYGDFSNVDSYKAALDGVMAANGDFLQLSAEIRARFDNEPVQLLEFLDNPDNLDEARELGIVAALPPEPEAVVENTGGDPPVDEVD